MIEIQLMLCLIPWLVGGLLVVTSLCLLESLDHRPRQSVRKGLHCDGKDMWAKLVMLDMIDGQKDPVDFDHPGGFLGF